MASRGVNKVILVGNLGADPDVRYMGSGDMVTSIRLATTEVWKDQESQLQERTEWHRVVFFRGLAEVAGDYLKKGSRIYIEGSLRTQQWEQNGEKRYTTEIIARELLMLDRFGDHEGNSNNGGQSGQNGANAKQNPAKPPQNRSGASKSQTHQQKQNQRQPAPVGAGHVSDYDDEFDDEIPF